MYYIVYFINILFIKYYIWYIIYYILYYIYCILYICILYIIYYIFYIVYYILDTIYYILYVVYYILYILYIIHYTYYLLFGRISSSPLEARPWAFAAVLEEFRRYGAYWVGFTLGYPGLSWGMTKKMTSLGVPEHVDLLSPIYCHFQSGKMMISPISWMTQVR